MPVFQYFAWVGSCLLAALVAANWWSAAPIARRSSDVLLNQKINIRIHSDHKWPERVDLDTTRSAVSATDSGRRDTPTQAERQPLEAFAKISAGPIGLCFRPPCSTSQVADWGVSPIGNAAQKRSRSSSAAHKVLTLSNPLHRPPGKS